MRTPLPGGGILSIQHKGWLWMAVWMVMEDAAEIEDWYTTAQCCAACGVDCWQHEQDTQAHTVYGLCAACLAECEAEERCWTCLARPCNCQVEEELS